MTTDVCNPKKIRLGGSTAGEAAASAAAAPVSAASRMLQELVRKCTCSLCSQVASAPVMSAKCGHCVCAKCTEELRGAVAGAAAAAASSCGACGRAVSGEELTKRDHATEKLLNAVKVLEEHIRAQEAQPELERARCADCLGKSAPSGGDVAEDGGGYAGAASNSEAAVRRCEELRQDLQRLAEDGERSETGRRQALEEAAAEMEAWRNRLADMLAKWHEASCGQLETIRQRADQLLAEEGLRRRELRAAAEDLQHLLESPQRPPAELAAAEARATEQRARLAGTVGGSFELARRGQPDTLADGFAALLAQSGLDLVVRPYARALDCPEPKVTRSQRTGGLEPWDFALLVNTQGLYYTPDGQLKIAAQQPQQQQGDEAGSSGEAASPGWVPLPSPCLIVNYKGFKTKRLHVFDTELKELASVRLQLKEGRMPGTIHVWEEKQIVITVDHSRCKVCQFDLTGKLVRKLGGRGNGPSQFRQPMTAQVHENLLYVVDSDNKRVQIFEAESQQPVGSLTHDGFSTDLHSVLASETRIIVTDRDNAKAFVFEKASRRLIREVALGGKPFCVISDPEGHLFISLTNERKVLVYDPAMAHRLHTLAVTRKPQQRKAGGGGGGGGLAASAAATSSTSADAVADDDEELDEEEEEEESSSSDGGSGFGGILAGLKKMAGGGASGKPPFIYGIAFDGAARRLYVADTFCHAILAYQL